FLTPQPLTVVSGIAAVGFADFNNDGRPDLATANFGSGTTGVSVLLDDRAPIAVSPSYASQQTYGTGSSPHSVVAADVNRDGKLDLVVADQNSGSVGVLLGNGNGTFQAEQSYATGTTPFSANVADLNGDGILDIIAGEFGGSY